MRYPFQMQPVTEPVGFLNSPLALEWVDSEAITLKPSQNFGNDTLMVLPALSKTVDVVDIKLQHPANVLHDFLSKVGRLFTPIETCS